ncbi:abortive infection system antitoxin AbiGi family protein [Cellvibrio sp. NN19]|uniref:abortive infection system antitoxin AbiGi family protein n=1 Tax=Cellvibrio chitinivorans TaxID=3102792 RepID=UPI002B40D66A|nr:abortive infection system antitoxin AbiGi family protein [Cellvibrio sp. NN19]
MRPKSNTLFHFTKNIETLKLILEHGFWPRYCLEDISWLGYDKFDYIAYPMVCFCDIPLSRISEHIGFYGEFGLGLTRQWGHLNGLNPILYSAGNNNLTNSFRGLNDHSNKLEGEDIELCKTTMRYLLAYTKPTSGKMVIDGVPVEKEFYQESEWRYVPQHEEIKPYIRKSKFENKDNLDIENSLTKENCTIKFGPGDIRYIFVKSDADIPNIINFIHAALGNISVVEQKVLMSRVVSLESLSIDL